MSPKQFGEDVFFHGTAKENVDSIRRQGFAPSPTGAMGRGVYVTPEIGMANSYASGTAVGKRRAGTVFAVRAEGPPLMNGDNWGQRTYNPDQLTVVHKQNVHPTSADRAYNRKAGFPPLPDTGPKPFTPTPVSQLPKSEVRRRLSEIKRGAQPSRDTDGLLAM